jgi:predicted glycosyltransferase
MKSYFLSKTIEYAPEDLKDTLSIAYQAIDNSVYRMETNELRYQVLIKILNATDPDFLSGLKIPGRVNCSIDEFLDHLIEEANKKIKNDNK